MRLLLAALFLLFAAPAVAGTFCVAGSAMTPQCFYEDVQGCTRASDPPSTYCMVNPDAYLSYVGGGRYCTVGSERVAQCLYTDRSQCNSEASRTRSLCLDRDGMTDENNPYRYDNRVQN